MKRAMTETAKAEKAKQILQIATEMYRSSTFEALKMSSVAKAANVSNGTLFFYYKTKEILFMEMLFLEYEKRFDHLLDLLRPYGKMTYEQFKAFFLGEMDGLLDADSLLIRLSVIKSTVLEKNIDRETAVKGSLYLHDSFRRIAEAMMEKADFLSADAFYELMLAQNAIIVGYVNMAVLPQAIEEAIDEHGLHGFRLDFRRSTLTAMAYYLDGWFAKRDSST